MSIWAFGAISAPAVLPLLRAALDMWKWLRIERSRAKLVTDVLGCAPSRGVAVDIRDGSGGTLRLRLDADSSEILPLADPEA